LAGEEAVGIEGGITQICDYSKHVGWASEALRTTRLLMGSASLTHPTNSLRFPIFTRTLVG